MRGRGAWWCKIGANPGRYPYPYPYGRDKTQTGTYWCCPEHTLSYQGMGISAGEQDTRLRMDVIRVPLITKLQT